MADIIALESEAKTIGGSSGSVTTNLCCTSTRASALNCTVSGTYSSNQLVCKKDLSKKTSSKSISINVGNWTEYGTSLSGYREFGSYGCDSSGYSTMIVTITGVSSLTIYAGNYSEAFDGLVILVNETASLSNTLTSLATSGSMSATQIYNQLKNAGATCYIAEWTEEGEDEIMTDDSYEITISLDSSKSNTISFYYCKDAEDDEFDDESIVFIPTTI